MYHRVGHGKHANSEQMLKEHLKFLKERFEIVLPGDPLSKRKLSICLTFDDASFDFYHFVFPMLKELKIRTVLGVPTRYILDSTKLAAEERLSVPYTMAMQDGFFDQKVPFCTWEELNEMVKSGLVEVASHSHMHCNLTFDFVDLNREVANSKQIIETNLCQPVSTFIYPFGRTNAGLHEYMAEHYPYAFRIGSALNAGWGKGNKPLSRIPCDQMKNYAEPLSYARLAKYAIKGILS